MADYYIRRDLSDRLSKYCDAYVLYKAAHNASPLPNDVTQLAYKKMYEAEQAAHAVLERVAAVVDKLPRCDVHHCADRATHHGDHFYCDRHKQEHSVELPYAEPLRALARIGEP